MHYCINSLLEINNEIMQYCNIINDIALIMHYRALLKGSVLDRELNFFFLQDFRALCIIRTILKPGIMASSGSDGGWRAFFR